MRRDPVTAAAISARTMNGARRRSISALLRPAAPAPAGRSSGGVGGPVVVVVLVLGGGVERRAVVHHPALAQHDVRWIRSASGPSSWSTTTMVAPALGQWTRASRRWPPGWPGRRRRSARRGRAAPARPARVRAISTRCCWPPDSVETWWRARSARTDGLQRLARSRRGRSRRAGPSGLRREQPSGGDHLGHRRGHALGDRRALRHVAEPVPLPELGQRLAEERDAARCSAGTGRPSP